MKAHARSIARIAPRLALAGLLAATAPASALDGFGPRPTGPLAFDQGDAQGDGSPYYLRYDYAIHERPYHALNTDHRLVATYDNVGVLAEHTASYPGAPAGALWMDRAAFVVGARDESGDSLHLGIGQTVLYGAQKDRLVSLLLLASTPVTDHTAFELNLGLPASGVGRMLSLRSTILREGDGEAALAFQTRHAALRLGYRTFAVRDAPSAAGWFAGLSIYF